MPCPFWLSLSAFRCVCLSFDEPKAEFFSQSLSFNCFCGHIHVFFFFPVYEFRFVMLFVLLFSVYFAYFPLVVGDCLLFLRIDFSSELLHFLSFMWFL